MKKEKIEIHNCPWTLAYELYKDHYSKDEIDEMLFCEITELITNYDD